MKKQINMINYAHTRNKISTDNPKHPNWSVNNTTTKPMLTRHKFNILHILYIILLFGISLNILIPSFLYSQIDTAWVRRYSGITNDDDGAEALVVDDAGNVYITGYTYNSNQGFNYITIKYSANGVEQWAQTYNHTDNGNDRASAIAIDNLGNIYVTGISFSYATGYDCATIKYNSSGTIQWVQRYNGFGNGIDCGNAIMVDDLNNVYVVGYSDSLNNRDYLIIKYNPSGNIEWVRKYNGTANSADVAKAIAIDDSNYIYVTGRSEGIGTTADYVTIKYHPTGQMQWVQRYNGTGNNWDEPYAIAVDAQSNVYITGESEGVGTVGDILTIKYNAAGNQMWVQRYNADNSYDYGTDITVDSQGNVYVTGPSTVAGVYDYVTIKYNASGTQIWAQRYNGPANGEDKSTAIAIDNAGNLYVTGKSYGGGTSHDYATVKYNSNGVQQWVIRYNSPNNASDGAADLEVDNQGYVYVTGTSSGDCVTIKYVQTAGIEEKLLLPTKNLLTLNAIPNPFINQTTIQYSLPQKSNVLISIYDASGTLIKHLVKEQKEAGTYSANWDGTDNHNKRVRQGIYFYVLKTDDNKMQRKMLMLK
ncbi:MAG: SBBP repeat-containing protein [candidate division WOR-3 bacterium]|nr:SBBP repeat-containing protein [candidate division WOR-3 bacterium]